jgi:Tetratricopeptide repeat
MNQCRRTHDATFFPWRRAGTETRMTKRTDFDIELSRVEEEIACLSPIALAQPMNAENATKFVYLLYQHASLTGILTGLAQVELVLNDIIQHLGPAGDLYFLKANLDFKFHRLADVRRDLETGRGLKESSQGRTLQADLDFQEGRYDAARHGYESLLNDEVTWDNLARLAYLKWKLGDSQAADELYKAAEDELTAKQMRNYAWIELQRGVLNLRRGRYEQTVAHYEKAERAYSGYWLIDEHKAELLGARGDFEKAAALYESVVDRVPRPEFQQALCELYLCMGNAELAQSSQERALAGYLESAELGHVHYYHHLADFFADVVEDGEEAIKWAVKDLELRENFSTQAALAWALYRAGEVEEAVAKIKQALLSGVTDAHLFFQAGKIYESVGEKRKADHYFLRADEINPHHRSFHVHR